MEILNRKKPTQKSGLFVIYRDKIKDVGVRDCVANSGLLDLYDATLGLSDSAK